MSNPSLAEQLAVVTGRSLLGASEGQGSPLSDHSVLRTFRDGPAILNPAVEKVIVQFSFTFDFLVPKWLYEEKRETRDERDKRKSIPHKGEQFWQGIKHTDMRGLRQSVVDEGFVLVDAYLKERINGASDPRSPDYYHTVRFTFYRTPSDMTDAWREVLKEKAGPSLDVLVKDSLWRVRGFKNPFFREGVMVDGMKSVSINLEYPEAYEERADEHGRSKNHVFKVEDHELIIL